MRILAIRGRNLASLAGDFEVDFTQDPLATAGLFAISGPTGAGKSTLLDTLCLALFDDTPRLRSATGKGIEVPDVGSETTQPKDPRNLLRRGSAEGFAEVDFVGNDRVSYRARWSVRRARNRIDGRLQNTDMSLLRLDDLQPVCGSGKTEVRDAITSRIGLDFEQFTRAVLLAQNEFHAFLKAGEDERATLLQTLTGTDRFEQLSIRAYNRNKSEQARLEALRSELGQHAPLDDAARAALEGERDGTQKALREAEMRSKGLQARIAWHRELAQARQREATALAERDAALAAREAARAQRDALARVESVQAAAPLLREHDRLATELDAATKRSEDVRKTLQQAEADARSAESRRDAAGETLRAIDEHAERAAPLLAAARALTTEIATLQPEHERLVQVADTARRQLNDATGERSSNSARLDALTRELGATQHWLAENGALATLAANWPQWRTLLAQAKEAADEASGLAERLEAATKHVRSVSAQVPAAQSAVEKCEAAFVRAQSEVAEDARRLEGIDAQQLARERAAIDIARGYYHAASKARAELDAAAAQANDFREQLKGAGARLDANDARASTLANELPAAEAANREADEAWRTVFEATRASVIDLRERLLPGQPCPVCGAAEHPYATHDPALGRALDQLASRRDTTQAALNALRAETTALTRDSEALRNELERLQVRLSSAEAGRSEADERWRKALAPLATAQPGTPAPPDDAPVEAIRQWLNTVEQAQKAQQEGLAATEATLHAVQQSAAAARVRLDQAREARQAAKDALATRQNELVTANAAHDAAKNAHETAEKRLASILMQLDAAAFPVTGANSWRDQWRADAAAFAAHWSQQVEAWRTHDETRIRLEQEIQRLTTQGVALERAVQTAQTRLSDADVHLGQLVATLAKKNTARTETLDTIDLAPLSRDDTPCPTGAARTVDAVESFIRSCRNRAASTLRECEDATKTAQQHHTMQQATLAALASSCDELRQAQVGAHDALEQWSAEFNGQHPEDLLDTAKLRTLLAHDGNWIAAQRKALAALDARIASAEGALTHARQAIADRNAPPVTALNEEDCARSPDELDATTEALDHELSALREAVARINGDLHRDAALRESAARLVARIAEQEKSARIWWQINDLIGSADGKKFRNHAQQLTLDILLGQANAHLRDLARRYRLERIPGSLALMVVDQDMGDERRSVHSLSGGESFLVSLALALGLASLSSQRVRVESLFIDEGFGSLDEETLRIAMDALDRLQAMGRKVGVISHVQEMTERIGTRIHVHRQPGGRSRVEVRGIA